jgi:hypothetical protein
MTCSILPSENERVTDVPFLKKCREKTCLPDLEGNDGGYACLLKR